MGVQLNQFKCNKIIYIHSWCKYFNDGGYDYWIMNMLHRTVSRGSIRNRHECRLEKSVVQYD